MKKLISIALIFLSFLGTTSTWAGYKSANGHASVLVVRVTRAEFSSDEQMRLFYGLSEDDVRFSFATSNQLLEQLSSRKFGIDSSVATIVTPSTSWSTSTTLAQVVNAADLKLKQKGIDITQFQHVVYLGARGYSLPGGALGTTIPQGKDCAVYKPCKIAITIPPIPTASTSGIPLERTFVHELFHHYSLPHASNQGGESGDPTSVMGYGCVYLNGLQVYKTDMLDPGAFIKVTEPGIYELGLVDPSNPYPQILVFENGTSSSYIVSHGMRQTPDFRCNYAFESARNNPLYTNGLLFHKMSKSMSATDNLLKVISTGSYSFSVTQSGIVKKFKVSVVSVNSNGSIVVRVELVP